MSKKINPKQEIRKALKHCENSQFPDAIIIGDLAQAAGVKVLEVEHYDISLFKSLGLAEIIKVFKISFKTMSND